MKSALAQTEMGWGCGNAGNDMFQCPLEKITTKLRTSHKQTNKQTNKQSSENSFAAFAWRRGGGGKAMGVMKKPLTGVKGSYKIMFDPVRFFYQETKERKKENERSKHS